jgi:hypothetical protein
MVSNFLYSFPLPPPLRWVDWDGTWGTEPVHSNTAQVSNCVVEQLQFYRRREDLDGLSRLTPLFHVHEEHETKLQIGWS